MRKLRTLIVDDNERFVKDLKSMLKPHQDKIELIENEEKEVIFCKSLSEAADCIDKYKPDLVFWDIGLEDTDNSLTYFENVNQINFEFILLTATTEIDLLVQATRYQPIMCIRKGDFEFSNRICEAIEIAQQEILPPELPAPIPAIFNDIIILPIVGNGTSGIFRPAQIIYFYGQGNYTHLYLVGKNEKVVIGLQLGKIVEKLQKRAAFQHIIRVSKSYIINIYEINRISRDEGNLTAYMNGGGSATINAKNRHFFE